MADQVCDNLTVNRKSNLLGNVGIGTSNPKELVQIGNQISFHNGGWKGLAFNGYYDNNTWKRLENGYISTLLWDTNEGVFRFQTGPKDDKDKPVSLSERLTILNNGNVGIGAFNPGAKLEVNGDIKVTGDVILTNADCAEDFDIIGAESIEPGTVMVIDNDGALRASEKAYDKRVAGVISGAGDYHPGITLDRQKERENRLPLALTGKVYCKVDAECGPVEVGDLLTTSSTIGYAMKAKDRGRSFGSIIGKALHKLEDGRGLIPILVALQ